MLIKIEQYSPQIALKNADLLKPYKTKVILKSPSGNLGVFVLN